MPSKFLQANLQVHTIPTRSQAHSCSRGHRVTWRCARGRRRTLLCCGHSRSCHAACGVGGAVVTLYVVTVVALHVVVVAVIAPRVVSRSQSSHRAMLQSWWLSSSHVVPHRDVVWTR